MTQKFHYKLPDLAATQKLAKQLASEILPGQTVFLQGELGAGKTALVKALLAAWGHQGLVTSPTYTLVEPYNFSNFTVYHFDLYRITNAQELAYIGLDDYFTSNSICLIEWPERALGFLPKPDITIQIYYADNDARHCVIEKS